MKRPVVFLTLLFLFGSIDTRALEADTLHTLLLAGRYDDARRALSVLAEAQRGPYLGLLDRLAAPPPDSIARRVVLAGTGFRGKFSRQNAGAEAETCFVRCLAHAEAQRFVAAYEQYAIAEFLRLEFLKSTRNSWYSDLEAAKNRLAAEDTAAVQQMISAYRSSPTPEPLRSSRDSADYLWGQIERSTKSMADRARYESGRRLVQRRFLLAAWGSIVSRHELRLTHMNFIVVPEAYSAVFRGATSTFKFTRRDFGAEAGVFVSPSFAAGGLYFRSTQSLQAGMQVSVTVFPRKLYLTFPADILYEGWGIFAKYLLDDREGFRPYVQISYQSISAEIKFGTVTPDFFETVVVSSSEHAPHLGVHVGLEYLLAVDLPLTWTVFVEGLMNLKGDYLLLPRRSWRIVAKVGVLFW